MSIYKRFKKVGYPEIDDGRLHRFSVSKLGSVMLMLKESGSVIFTSKEYDNGISVMSYMFANLPERMWWEPPFS